MKEVLPRESNLVESWIELATTTASYSANPIAQAIAKATQDHKEDP